MSLTFISCNIKVIYVILELTIIHNEYFYFWYFKYILMLIYLSKILNAGLLLVTEYFYTVVLLLLVQNLDTSSKTN